MDKTELQKQRISRQQYFELLREFKRTDDVERKKELADEIDNYRF